MVLAFIWKTDVIFHSHPLIKWLHALSFSITFPFTSFILSLPCRPQIGQLPRALIIKSDMTCMANYWQAWLGMCN